MRMTRTITYNGKSVKTKYHSALEWQEFHELRAQYYAKPSIEQVLENNTNVRTQNNY